MSTREKILDTALALFNKNGTATVSTNHIAEAAGMSPGNLYYHFHNKEEIIRALFERLHAANAAGFELPIGKQPSLHDLQEFIRFNYKTLWQYRFAYRELVALLRSDPKLKNRFVEVRQRGLEGFRQLVNAFAAAGMLQTLETTAEIENLAQVIWIISEFWLNSLEISGETVNKSQMERGVKLMLQVLKPYIKKGEARV